MTNGDRKERRVRRCDVVGFVGASDRFSFEEKEERVRRHVIVGDALEQTAVVVLNVKKIENINRTAVSALI